MSSDYFLFFTLLNIKLRRKKGSFWSFFNLVVFFGRPCIFFRKLGSSKEAQASDVKIEWAMTFQSLQEMGHIFPHFSSSQNGSSSVDTNFFFCKILLLLQIFLYFKVKFDVF